MSHGVRALLCFYRNMSPWTGQRKMGVGYLARRGMSTASQGPLKGIRVLDLSRVLAGPFASMVLGDLGADVIKVENPKGGDDTRAWGPPFVGGESAYFLCVNRNKRSIAVNFKDPAGKAVIRDLVKHSDVLLENFIPGKLEKEGLGYEALREVNPGLVYCSISGFGADGPLAQRPGYDVIVQGMYGLMSITGAEDGPPAKTGVALTDICTGLFAHGAILAALHHRQQTGVGQKIDCSLMETQLACLANIGQNWLLGAVNETRRWGSGHESIVPYQAFECKDGLMYMVGAGNDKQFVKLAAAVGMPELSSDPRFVTNKDRTKNRKLLIPILQQAFKSKTRDEWGKMIEGLGGLPCGPLRNVGEGYRDEQARHRRMVETVQHPTAGNIPLAGIPVKYSESQPAIRLPPPLLGQHTKEVLQGLLDYSQDKLAGLQAAGVIGGNL